jgi:hypothetical protein
VVNVPPSIPSVTIPINPVELGSLIMVRAAFSDPAGVDDEPYACSIDFGDGSDAKPGSVTGMECRYAGYEYLRPGIYQVTVDVSDDYGDTGSKSADEFVVIYDPEGGFVTGGGWIESPAGAYKSDQNLIGKASFGFVSKYKKGAQVPTGNTEFQFKAGDLNFHSTNYDWLVVTGSDYARFKGTGTINGEGEYKFMVWAGDREPDTFRIKIWEEVEGVETVVYDNGMDQGIGGGNVVVHKAK